MEIQADAEHRIRSARPSDLNALLNICYRTSNYGNGPEHPSTDPDLVGNIYIAPYLFFEPDGVFVLQSGDTVNGYICAATDTQAFDSFMRNSWLPKIQQKIPRPPADRTKWSIDDEWRDTIYNRGSQRRDISVAYPAHLHINLLSGSRGKGCAAQMMEVLFSYIRSKKVRGVHLGVSKQNQRAVRFYQKMCFTSVLAQSESSLTIGRTLE